MSRVPRLRFKVEPLPLLMGLQALLVADSRNALENTAGIDRMLLKNWWAVLESNQRPMD